MISLVLGRRLRAAGVVWRPADGDRFVVPDCGMDDVVFTVSDMTVEVREVPSVGRLIAFNGTTEWALDSVLQHEVIWLPGEPQLRELLGDAFVKLERDGETYRCHARVAGTDVVFASSDAAEAYCLALLESLRVDAEHGCG
jgi:hypothetical protein